MIKRIIVLSALLVMFTAASARALPYSYDILIGSKNIVSNRVAKISEYNYYKASGSSKLGAVYIFDARSNITGSTRYDGGGNVFRKTEYEYDESGLESGCAEFDENGLFRFRCEDRYDLAGKKIAEIFFAKGNRVYCLGKFRYDDRGNLAEYVLLTNKKKLSRISENLDERPELFKTLKYSYDDKGSLTGMLMNDSSNEVFYRKSYKYDSGNRIVESSSEGKDGRYRIDTNYKYDDRNNLVEMISKNASGEIRAWKKFEYEFYTAQQAAAKVIKPPGKTVVTGAAAVKPAGPPSPAESVIEYPVLADILKDMPEITEEQYRMSQDVYTINSKMKSAAAPSPAPVQPVASSAKQEYQVPDECLKITVFQVVRQSCDSDYESIKKMFESQKFDVNMQTDSGASLLMMAASYGNENLVKYLLDRDADVMHRDNRGNKVFDYLKRTGKKVEGIRKMLDERKREDLIF